MEMELLSEATSSSKGFHIDECSLTLNGEHIQDWRNCCTLPKQLILDRDGTYLITMKVNSIDLTLLSINILKIQVSRIRAEVDREKTQNLLIGWNLDAILQKESNSERLCFQTLEVYLEVEELDDLRTLELQLDETQWKPAPQPLQIQVRHISHD